jgi:uncharacterized protein (TIGR02246 family)
MRIAAFTLGLVAATLAGAGTTAAQNGDSPGGQETAAKSFAAARMRPEDDKAIRQVVDAFVKDYNHHDAPAIAALFATDGMAADDEGNVARGREAIEQVFATIFKEHPQTRIENAIESIRMVGPAEAVETGTATIRHDEKTPAEKSRYRVIHVKQDGKWRMASATDLPQDTWGGEAQLKQLGGLIGDWVDESPDAIVLTSYRWTDNHRFILGQFTVQIGGKPAMTGSQRIGWDPLKKTIRSWVFDSEGGFAEGLWSRSGNAWVAKLSGVTRNGKSASATHTIMPAGKDRMILQTVDRVVGGEKMPDGEKILVVRRPPAPQ